MKKIRPFALVLLAFVLLLSACSSGAGDATGDEQGTDATNEEDANNDDAPGKLALSWFTPVSQASTVLPDESDDFVKQTIEEKFNVDLDITYMASGNDYDNQLNVQIAGGDTPDMFYTTGTNSQTYALDGILADMTPFVSPDTMPNYFKWVTEGELERYQIHDMFVRAPIPFARNVYRSHYVRQDWLDNLDLDAPTTYDELMDVMRAFTFDDPDGNGKDDTYGMSASGNGESISWDLPQWIHNGLIGAYTVQDGEYKDHQTDPRVEQMINEAVGMIDEGIIDPDWFLNEGLAHLDKAAQGKVGVVVASGRDIMFDSNPNSVQTKTKAINPDAEWTAINPFQEQRGVWMETEPGSPFVFPQSVAEESPEKIERSVEILDWLVSEEGYLMTHYGKEGEHYTRDGDTITIDPEAIQADIVEKGNFLDVYNWFTPEEPEVLGLEVIDPRMTDRDREMDEQISSYPLIPAPGASLTPPDGFNLADFRTKMREYHVQMLFDEKSGDNWPEYREILMTDYEGRKLFQNYVENIRAVGIEVADFE